MNLFSARRSALLLFAIVFLEALLSVEAIDFKKLFDKNKKPDESDKKEKAGETVRSDSRSGKSTSSDGSIDKELEKLTEVSPRPRRRVDMNKINAAMADANRIATAPEPVPASQPEDDVELADYHEPSIDIRRRRRPSSAPARFIPNQGSGDQSQGVHPDGHSDEAKTDTDDKSLLKPAIRARRARPNMSKIAQMHPGEPRKSTFSHLAGKMNKGLKTGFKQMAKGISEIPSFVGQATDSLSAMLQLDSKGRLLSLIEEVKGDIHFVKKEFSKFTITWSPIMEKALNYLGDHDLDRVKINAKDELDFSSDALHSLVFGYEFMKLMMAWRENLLVAHEAYKLYLETVKDEIVEAKSISVDEDFIFQMKTIHAYMLLSAWVSVNELILEPRMKLDYLMEVEDDRPKNYESEYFRNIIILQEYYEPTIKEFEEEERQVTEAIGQAGALTEDFEDVDDFFDAFRTKLVEENVKSIDWESPKGLHDFMKKLQPQLQFNPLVYSRSFKKEIKEALQNAREVE